MDGASSGGGFRATLFHLGSLWRLNELGWLTRLSEITSVSGGSITAAYLGFRWQHLYFESTGYVRDFVEEIVQPLRAFCSRTIDVGSIVAGLLSPFRHPSEFIVSHYRKGLFGNATLQDLPADQNAPRFTIYATNLQTGADVRLSRSYLADYHLGMVKSPTIELAFAVGASSAFPPPLCPVQLELPPNAWEWVKGADLFDQDELRSKMLLADGGIYDNLGLERVWDRYTTVLVSDAGAPFSVCSEPAKLRLSQLYRTKRVLDIVTGQTRALRIRKLVDDFIDGKVSGTYWGIGTQVGHYELEERGHAGPLVNDSDITRALSRMRTRLNRFSDEEQELLINWGYSLTDAAMRRHVLPKDTQPGRLPYPYRPL